MALIVVAPWLVWLALPVAFVLSRSGRARLAVPAVVVTGAACLLALTTWRALGAIACADDGLWRHAVLHVALPGISAQASSWIALRQAVAVAVGDVHLFGVALAVFGGIVAEPAQRRLRQATLAWVGASVLAVAAGLLPPALAAAALLPWWAPWSAVGALALVARVPARQQRLAMAFMVIASAGLPLLRHATVVPGPWVAGQPALLRATAPSWRGMWLASEESTATRRLRAAGIDTVPADAFTLTSCLADGRRIAALGPVLRHVEEQGFLLQDARYALRLPRSLATCATISSLPSACQDRHCPISARRAWPPWRGSAWIVAPSTWGRPWRRSRVPTWVGWWRWLATAQRSSCVPAIRRRPAAG